MQSQSLTNEQRSTQEVTAFRNFAPSPYVAYHAYPRAIEVGDHITTWTGDELATVIWAGEVYRSGFGIHGNRRQNFRVRGINDAIYSGTAYLDAGDYVRMRKVAS